MSQMLSEQMDVLPDLIEVNSIGFPNFGEVSSFSSRGFGSLMSPLYSVAVPAIVNFALLAATTYKSWRVTKDLEGLQLPILKRFLRDGVLHFLGITIACGPTVYFFSRESTLH